MNIIYESLKKHKNYFQMKLQNIFVSRNSSSSHIQKIDDGLLHWCF